MSPIKEHTIYKLSVVVLALALLAPTFVKFSHVFEMHSTHVVCKNPQETHFHKFNLDCEFCKFKLNTQWFLDTNSYQLVNQHKHYQVPSLHYSYLCNYLPLAFLLRGPPQMI